MFFRDNIYTVHENKAAIEPADRILLVREGFNIWAFVFTVLWLLVHRLWLVLGLYVALAFLIVKGGEWIGLSDTVRGMLGFGLQLWLGFSASDFQSAALERNGYVFKGVVCGESSFLAQRRYYDHLQQIA